MNTIEKDNAYVLPTYARAPIDIVGGKGSLLYDADGKTYIDLGTGIAVNTLGVADEGWCQAVTRQLSLFQHTSNLYYHAPGATLAETLCKRTGYARVFFSNSGAEANECAIKAARLYAAKRYGAERYHILTLQNSFHGRTITTLAATGQEVFHQDFTPLTDGFHALPIDIEEIRRKMDTLSVAAVMIEPVQGEGGVVPLPPAFVKELAALCKERDILLIADEVQTGNGRTGTLYAYMQYGVEPDILSTAKGLAGGLPLGATLMTEAVAGHFTAGMHGSTFGANPVACAGACYVLSVLTDEFLARVSALEALARKTLDGARGIVSVTGKGLMLGVEVSGDAGAILAECRARGVIVLRAKNKIRLLPALNIPEELFLRGLTVLKDVAAACSP